MNQPLKAVVRDGHIVVTETTDLAEGTELQVVVVEEDITAEPWMDDDEAQAFRASLAAGIADEEAGRVVDADVVLAELRARVQAS